MPATSSVGVSGNSIVDGVLSGGKWATGSLTFSFPASASLYGSAYGSGEPTNGFEAFNSTQQAAVRDVLKQYSAVANLTFTEITETSSKHADLRFAESNKPGTAWAYYPTTRAEGGDAWFNHTHYNSPAKGNYAYMTMLHEIGHAFGLKHAHEASGSFGAMPAANDSMEFTVMSYRSYVGGSTTSGYTNETWGYAQSLMMADIAALQKMYGANFGTNSGNTVYSWSPATGVASINGVAQTAPGGNKILQTVWDGGGVDTYDFSAYTTNLSVDLQPGGWTTLSTAQLAKLHYNGTQVARGNVANAILYNNDQRSLIENANGGSGNDTILGNAAANYLKGNGGNDKLTGGLGNDTVDGGAGSDVAVFSGLRSHYTVVLLADGWVQIADSRSGADGSDKVANVETFQFSDRTYTLAELTQSTATPPPPPPTETPATPTPAGVTLTGTSSANSLTGGAGNDRISGLGGNDTLKGVGGIDVLSGGAGNDSLDGGDGNDVLEGGSGSDKLQGGAGLDTASYAGATAGVTADLGKSSNNRGDASGDSFSSIENLTGSGFADTLRGNSGANRIDGGAGNDLLTGGGGNDVLDGAAGSDTATYSTRSTFYSWVKNSDGSWTVTDLRSGKPDGIDTLWNVEALRFSDKTVKLAAAASSGHGEAEHDHLDRMPLPQSDTLAFKFLSGVFGHFDSHSSLADLFDKADSSALLDRYGDQLAEFAARHDLGDIEGFLTRHAPDYLIG
jgi:serralysin